MTATRPAAGDAASRGIITGTLSNGQTLYQDVDVTENNTVITDADTWEWQLNLYEFESETTVLALSTTDGTITVTQAADATVLGLRVAFDIMAGVVAGDYEAFLGSTDLSDRRILWARGTVTVREEVFWVG